MIFESHGARHDILEKRGDLWVIVHEHESVPVDVTGSMQPDLESKPQTAPATSPRRRRGA